MVTFLFPDKIVRKHKRLSGKLILVKTDGPIAPAQQGRLRERGTNWPGDLNHTHTKTHTHRLEEMGHS